MAEYRSLSQHDVDDFLQPDESVADLMYRLRHERLTTGLDFLDHQMQLRPGGLMEVCGPAGCGKSMVLLHVAATIVVSGATSPLVTNHDHMPGVAPQAAGRRAQVVLIDMDGKMDTVQLIQVLRGKLQAAFPQAAAAVARAEARLSQLEKSACASGQPWPPPNMQQAVSGLQATLTEWKALERDCLARVHVLSIHSSLQLLAGVVALLPRLQQWKVAGQPCTCILLDNVGSFSYQDKAAKAAQYTPQAGHMRSDGSHWTPIQAAQAFAPPLLHITRVWGAINSVLLQVSRQLRLCVLATRACQVNLQEPDDQGPARLHIKEYMPPQWTQHVTHRLVMSTPFAQAGPHDHDLPITRVTTQLSQVQGAVQYGPLLQVDMDDSSMHAQPGLLAEASLMP